MKKLFAALVVFVAVVLFAVGIWRWRRASRATGKLPELRAMMKDEDAPRPLEPSLALRVNEEKETTLFTGTPLWFQVNANNANAINDLAGTQILESKVKRLKEEIARQQATPETLQRATADLQKRHAASTITLGDPTHPWTEAVQFFVRDEKGGEKPLGLALNPLTVPSGPAELDTVRTAQAEFGTASAGLAPGAYAVVACLGATGSWQGKTCSEPVKLTVADQSGNLTTEQQMALDRQKARYGLRSGDFDAVENYGRELLAADPASCPAHVYLGQAALGRNKPEVALREFVTARALYDGQKREGAEPPAYLNAMINQLLESSEMRNK